MDNIAYTLGSLIRGLSALKPETVITNIHNPHSYRGSYYELAFELGNGTRTAESLLNECLNILDTEMTGYKGGEFVMHEGVNIYISDYGFASGMQLIAIYGSEGSIVTQRDD